MQITDYLPDVPLSTRLDALTEQQLDSLEAWLVTVVGFRGMGAGLRARLTDRQQWGLTLGEYVRTEEREARE